MWVPWELSPQFTKGECLSLSPQPAGLTNPKFKSLLLLLIEIDSLSPLL